MVDVVIPRYEFRIFGKCWMNMKAKEIIGIGKEVENVNRKIINR